MATGTNTNNEDFAVGDAGDDATHWTMWDAAAGGTLKWAAALANNPAALQQNEFYRIQPGDISISIAAGADGATDSAASDAVRGVVNNPDGRYFQLHDGAPGANGTNNTLTGRKNITAFTFA